MPGLPCEWFSCAWLSCSVSDVTLTQHPNLTTRVPGGLRNERPHKVDLGRAWLHLWASSPHLPGLHSYRLQRCKRVGRAAGHDRHNRFRVYAWRVPDRRLCSWMDERRNAVVGFAGSRGLNAASYSARLPQTALG